jgi:hypothetical protein
MRKPKAAGRVASKQGAQVVIVVLALLGLLMVPVASQAAPVRKAKLMACGQLSAPGTRYSRFVVKTSGLSCKRADAVLLSWASHDGGDLKQGRVGDWRCHSGSKASLWFYCTRNLGKRSQAIAEAFHSPPDPPSEPASRGGLPGSHGPQSESSAAAQVPANIPLTLSTNDPVIGQEVTVTITNPASGADYEYYWFACGNAEAGDGCTLITNDTGPTITVTPLCGAPNPYYLEAGVSTPSGAAVPTASGIVVASDPITSDC